MRLPIPQKAQEQFMRDTGLAAHSAEHSWRWAEEKNGGQDSVGGFGELTKKGDPWWVPILHSTYPRDPGSPKVGMVSWNLKMMRFGGDCTPQSSSENMTGFLGLWSKGPKHTIFHRFVKQWDELEQVWKKPWIMFHVWTFAVQVLLFGGEPKLYQQQGRFKSKTKDHLTSRCFIYHWRFVKAKPFMQAIWVFGRSFALGCAGFPSI